MRTVPPTASATASARRLRALPTKRPRSPVRRVPHLGILHRVSALQHSKYNLATHLKGPRRNRPQRCRRLKPNLPSIQSATLAPSQRTRIAEVDFAVSLSTRSQALPRGNGEHPKRHPPDATTTSTLSERPQRATIASQTAAHRVHQRLERLRQVYRPRELGHQ